MAMILMAVVQSIALAQGSTERRGWATCSPALDPAQAIFDRLFSGRRRRRGLQARDLEWVRKSDTWLRSDLVGTALDFFRRPSYHFNRSSVGSVRDRGYSADSEAALFTAGTSAVVFSTG
jgi:hypothetical protein